MRQNERKRNGEKEGKKEILFFINIYTKDEGR